MSLLIVIVNYHGSSLTRDCLASLRPELPRLGVVRVGLCENGSGPDEVDRCRQMVDELELHPWVDFVPISPNLGFTGGNNAVIRPALESPNPPDFVLLLNNDTLVLPGAIDRLWQFMRARPEVGIAGSRLEYPDGETQRAARRFLSVVSEFESQIRWGPLSRCLDRWNIAPEERSQAHPTDWVPGAALMVRREVLDQIGLLDEGLYTYFDDVDFCLRARRAGWPTWYVPESRIVHLVGKTTGITAVNAVPRRRPAYWFQARRRFYLKNYGAAYAAAADVAGIAGQLGWRLRCALQRRPNPDSPGFLADLIRHSVFCSGFRVREVPNPALQELSRSRTERAGRSASAKTVSSQA